MVDVSCGGPALAVVVVRAVLIEATGRRPTNRRQTLALDGFLGRFFGGDR
jgi:hypothetical protein